MKKYTSSINSFLDDFYFQGSLSNVDVSFEDLLDSIKSYVILGHFDKAQKLVDYVLKSFKDGFFVFRGDRKDSILFLNVLVDFLYNGLKGDSQVFSEVNYDKIAKGDVKKYVKVIMRILKLVEKRFDEVYLTIRSLDDENKFVCLDNVVLLDCLEECSEVLNHLGYNKIGDYSFLLKGKLELGVHRYFYYPKYEVVLNSFLSSGAYVEAEGVELFRVLNYCVFDDKLVVNKLKFLDEKKVFEKGNASVFLLALNLLRLKDLKKFKMLLKKYEKDLLFFPELKMSILDFEKHKDIVESVNSDFVFNIEKLKNGRVLVNIREVKIANLFVRLFEK